MSFPSYPNSATVSDKADASLFMENFDSLIDGTSLGIDDYNCMSANVAENVLVNSDFACDEMTIDESFTAQTATVAGKLFTGAAYFNTLYAVSGASVVTINKTDTISDNILSANFQSFNKLNMNFAFTTDIIKISTANFVDGDICVFLNNSPFESVLTLKNSHVSGNIYCGTDIVFDQSDSVAFLYNGIDDSFDLLYWNDD